MGREFTGATDRIAATVTAIDTGDWTIAAWVLATAYTALRRIAHVETAGGTEVAWLGVSGATGGMTARQQFSTTTASASTDPDEMLASTWACVVAVFTAADLTMRIYIGREDLEISEYGYTAQVVGVGTRVTGGTKIFIGNRSTVDRVWEGTIGPVAYSPRAWSLEDAEVFRAQGAPRMTDQLRGWWPLDDVDAAISPDISGRGATGTVTGATIANGPDFFRDNFVHVTVGS